MKRAADNKRRYAPGEGSIPPVLLSGVSKGACPLAHDFAKQSVVCYTLCRRCRENAVAAGEGKGIWSGRKTGLCLHGVEPQAQVWFHQQTGRIWKPPSLVLRSDLWTKSLEVWPHSQKSRRTAGNPPKCLAALFLIWERFFSQNWNRREAILVLSRFDCPLAKIDGTVNGGAWNASFILTVDWPGWLCYPPINYDLDFISFSNLKK